MNQQANRIWPFVSICILIVLVIFAELFPQELIVLAAEDGPIENLTALLFLVSGLLFLWSARQAQRDPAQKPSYAVFFLIAWGVLMIVFAGEEISWGQRILDFDTPEAIDQANKQNEFNFHNLRFFDSFGGTGTYVSIFMLLVGLVLPLADKVFPWIGRTGVPVPSLPCCILFVGAYVYGIYFQLVPPKFEGDLQFTYFFRAVEVRELILALATLCFAAEMLRRHARAGSPARDRTA